jgi:hypothetical protein
MDQMYSSTTQVSSVMLRSKKLEIPKNCENWKSCHIHNYVYLIYPEELDIKNTTESDKSASYLDILLNIDSNGSLKTAVYDKRDHFDFAIINVVTYHFNQLMMYMSPSWFHTQVRVLRMRSFKTRQTTNK